MEIKAIGYATEVLDVVAKSALLEIDGVEYDVTYDYTDGGLEIDGGDFTDEQERVIEKVLFDLEVDDSDYC